MTELSVRSRANGRRPAQASAGADEDRLVARAQRGESEAFDELADRYSSRLRRTLYRITRDCEAAYDAMQEALVRAWQNIRRFKGRSRFYTWLTRIGINEAYRELNRSSVEMVELDDSVGERVPAWGDQPDEVFQSRELLAAVGEALTELPPDYRIAVELRDVQGLSTREAAETLGIGERALKSRLHRGRMAVRAKLDSYFGEGYL